MDSFHDFMEMHGVHFNEMHVHFAEMHVHFSNCTRAFPAALCEMHVQIAEMHVHIQSVLAQMLDSDSAKNFRILYGGSVNAENADEILRTDGVGGALVGGASLEAQSFLAIGRSCP